MTETLEAGTWAEAANAEKTLVDRIQQGDSEAFRDLYESYSRLIYRYVAVRVADGQEAEDLTAETFVKAWQNFPSFQWRGSPVGAWLIRIAHNLVIDKYRKQRGPLSWLPWHSEPGEKEFSRIEHRDEIDRALKTLSYEEQAILHLHYFEDYSLTEVAKFLDKTPNAVRVAQFRALRRLRQFLKHARP